MNKLEELLNKELQKYYAEYIDEQTKNKIKEDIIRVCTEYLEENLKIYVSEQGIALEV